MITILTLHLKPYSTNTILNKKCIIIVNNYDFTLKRFKIVVTNYRFDEDVLVLTFFFQTYTKLVFFLNFKNIILGQNSGQWIGTLIVRSPERQIVGVLIVRFLEY